jgi:hypothetical protein
VPLSLLVALSILVYTTVFALRTWADGNRRGGVGLLVLTVAVGALTAYVLFRP